MKLTQFLGIILTLSIVFGASATASGGYYVQVTNLSDGTTHWANVVAARHVSSCDDTDHGFYPETMGEMTIVSGAQNVQRTLLDKVLIQGRIREYACGNEISVVGLTIQPNWALAFDYTPGE